MATTYTNCQIIFAGNKGFSVGPGQEFISAVVTYPAQATPYFSIQLVRADASDIYLEGMDISIVRP